MPSPQSLKLHPTPAFSFCELPLHSGVFGVLPWTSYCGPQQSSGWRWGGGGLWIYSIPHLGGFTCYFLGTPRKYPRACTDSLAVGSGVASDLWCIYPTKVR
jgi:hypothetical protein